MEEKKKISSAVIRRLPRYYRYLGELIESGDAQSQETDGDIAAMAAMLAAGRGAQSQGIEAES